MNSSRNARFMVVLIAGLLIAELLITFHTCIMVRYLLLRLCHTDHLRLWHLGINRWNRRFDRINTLAICGLLFC